MALGEGGEWTLYIVYLVYQVFALSHELCLQAETCQVPIPNKIPIKIKGQNVA